MVTNTLGLIIGAMVHPAGLQDRDGALMVLRSIRTSWPWLRHIFTDSGYAASSLIASWRDDSNHHRPP
jgi:putative transposase